MVATQDLEGLSRKVHRQAKTPRTASVVVESKKPNAGSINARQALEALRMGTVPSKYASVLTVGRKAELSALQANRAVAQGMMIISGEYGTGKTHVLEVSQAQALDEGWLVATAVFDPIDVKPSNPLRIYSALMRGLRFPNNDGQGLGSLLEKIGDSRAHLVGKKWHRWLSPALFAHTKCDDQLANDVLEFVSGCGTVNNTELMAALRRKGYRKDKMYCLADWQTFGQIMAYLLGGIATWARDAGYKGLVIHLDEAEYLDHLTATSREMAENVLRYLAMATLPVESLGFNPDAVYRGGHPVHREVPWRFQADQPLVVACTFTPNPALNTVVNRIRCDGEGLMELGALAMGELHQLATRIAEVTQTAHPDFKAPTAHCQALAHAIKLADAAGELHSTRDAARLAVEFWDIFRHLGPDAALKALK
jgi:hypothetical protein